MPDALLQEEILAKFIAKKTNINKSFDNFFSYQFRYLFLYVTEAVKYF